MGIWEIVGANSLGAAVVVAEGAPTPPPDRLWSLCERHRVSILGLAPTLVRGLMPFGEEPVRSHDLSSLRVLASTGEPWNPDPYQWFSEVVGGGRLPIINISGGTEVGACFLSPTPAIPIKPCSLGGPALGMAVDVFDQNGNSVRGEVGELVCLKPWPAMTRGVWRDPGAVPRVVLAPLPRRVDARRLGARRRRRLLVPVRPLRRHAQRRRQADRADRDRVGRWSSTRRLRKRRRRASRTT